MEMLVQRYSSCDLVMSYAVCLRLVPLCPVHFKARLWLDLDMLGLSVSAGQSSSAAARAATRPTKSHNGVVAACALQCLCQLEMLRGGRYVAAHRVRWRGRGYGVDSSCHQMRWELCRDTIRTAWRCTAVL